MKRNTVIHILTWVLVLFALVAAGGAIAYFTNGFTDDFSTFYLNVEGKDVLTTASGYELAESKPMTVNVKYTFSEDGVNGYTVKVVPNNVQGKDFDFTLDGETYSFQGEDDLTAGFHIEKKESSFIIKPKGNLTEVMKALYPNSEVSDCTGLAYDDMFLLVVESFIQAC